MGNQAFSPLTYEEQLQELLYSEEFLGIILEDDLDDDLKEIRAHLNENRQHERRQASGRSAARQRDRSYALKEMTSTVSEDVQVESSSIQLSS